MFFREDFVGNDFNAFNHLPVQFFNKIKNILTVLKFHVKILALALNTNAEGLSKAHDHMGRKAAGITDLYIRTSECFLEKSHKIQMSDKFDDSGFGKLYPYFHKNLYLLMQIPQSNLAEPQFEHLSRQLGLTMPAFAFLHSLKRNALPTPQSRKSQGNISSSLLSLVV